MQFRTLLMYLFTTGVVANAQLACGGVEIDELLSSVGPLRATLSGSITKETVKQVDSMLTQARGRDIWLDLNSNGGDWDAAIAIGRRLRKVSSVAQVPDGAACSSACVLVLAGAQVRIVSGSGRVGIHRPYSPTNTAISLEQSQQRFQALSNSSRAFLREMNLPESLFEAMVRVPPEKLRFLTSRELQEFGLEGKDPAYSEVGDNAEAKALGIDKQEYLRRKARAQSVCANLAAQVVAAEENAAKSAQKVSKQKVNEGLAVGEKWLQCRQAVMRGERN